MYKMYGYSVISFLIFLTGCATTATQEPQIKRISAEELDRIMPKPIPNISLDELVSLSKITPPDELIAKLKAGNTQYDLTASQVVDLNKKGVDPKVLDYIHTARENAVRDGFADEINKREKQKQIEQQRLKRQYDSMRYYDPFWGYGGYGGYGPYWGRRPYGPGWGGSFRYGW